MDQVRTTQEERNRILFALKDAAVKLKSDARLDDRFWVGSESDADFKDRVYAYSWGMRRGLIEAILDYQKDAVEVDGVDFFEKVVAHVRTKHGLDLYKITGTWERLAKTAIKREKAVSEMEWRALGEYIEDLNSPVSPNERAMELIRAAEMLRRDFEEKVD